MFFAGHAVAQPTISSLSPNYGAPGTTVTISGANFNTTATNNVVWFGATKATVTSASTTSLTVTSPAGGTYSPVTVVDSSTKKSGVSQNPFIPSYNNSAYLSGIISFGANVEFTTPVTPYAVACADFDGDGKTDIAVVSQATTSTLSIYRNTSTSGSMTSSSFAAKVNFSLGNTASAIAIGDLNGDGKLDIVVNNQASNTISIFKNISTSGSFTTSSLATKFDITTGTTPMNPSIGDVDGDGKPEIIVPNSGANTVSVFRNVSSAGALTASSFSSAVTFTTATGPRTAILTDLNSDGKPEMVVTDYTSGLLSVFYNTSSSGTISTGSFATKVDFTTAGSPEYVVASDLDLNGKPDLIVTNNASSSVSVFYNTTSGTGAITTGSLATKVDFSTASNPKAVAVSDLDGDGLPDIAVGCHGAGAISVLRNTSSTGSFSTSSLAAHIDFATDTLPYGMAVADIDGDGYPDLVVTNNRDTSFSVFRNRPVVTPPTITSVSPNVANPGTSITITGTNFNTTAANNKVFFGATKATVTSASATSLTVNAPTGATYSTVSVTDTTTGKTGYEQYAYLPKYDNSPYIPNAVNFNNKVDFTNGTQATGAAFGDLDGDGKPDMVVISQNDLTVSVYRNTSTSGSITSGSFATKVDFGTVGNPYDLSISDVDGDGKPDLIVLVGGMQTVSVFKNTSSTGSISSSSFAAKVDFTLGSFAGCVATGDIDGDGKPEILVGDGSGGLAVLRNNTTPGSINATSFDPKVTITSTAVISSICIGDVDGDGKPDVIVPSGSSTVGIFRNTATIGAITTGSFASKVDFTTGNGTKNIVLGDIDGDGKPEMIIANGISNSVSVLKNTSSSGSITTGSFAAKVDFSTASNCYVALGDMDGDGKPDMVTANIGLSTASIFRNTASSGSISSGSFATKVNVATGRNPLHLVLADVDGDGKADIVTPNLIGGTVSVIRNNPISHPPVITSVSPNVANPGTSITITGTEFNTTAANNKVFFGATKATVTSASATSLTVTSPVGATYDMVTVTDTTTEGSGYEQYAYLPKYDNSGYVSGILNLAPRIDFASGASPTSSAVGDLDGDGKSDLVVANYTSNTISVYRNISSSGTMTGSSFATKVDFSSGSGPNRVMIRDVDGDGKPDIICSNGTSNTVSIFRNIGSSGAITTASFETKVDFATGSGALGLGAGDIDGDGKTDIVVANNASNTISVFRNQSAAGGINTSSFAAKVDFTTGYKPFGVAVGDLDGDGKADIAVTNDSSSTMSVFRNTATAGSIDSGSLATKVDFTTGTLPCYVAVGDIDGDGKPEIATANYGSNTFSLFRNTSSSGAITASSFAAKVDFTTGTQPEGISFGDLDGDGKTDIVVSNSGSNSVSLFRNTASSGSITSASLAAKKDFITGTSPYPVAIGDLDGDGKADVVVVNQGSTTVSVLQNAPLALPPTITSVSPNVANPGTSITITGTNFNTTAANNKVFFGATKATVTSASATSLTVTAPVGATYDMVSVTDTNTGASGYEQYAYLPKYDNSAYISNTVNFNNKVDFTTGTTPAAAAIADLDGDGKPDMVVPNQGSNTVSVYFNTSSSGSITSGSFATKVDFTTGTGPVHVTLADLDGDGKPEILVANSTANTVSVFKNTCTRGTITAGSFAAKIDYTTGTTPYNVCSRDLDGDGKPEIVVANSGTTTLSVFRNNTTPGSIVAGSFDPKVDFTTGTTPHNIAIGDVDGDGKPEVLVANNGTTTVSVFKNTATLGTITTGSLATKVDFTTGTTPQAVALGDIDGDGKPEMMVTNQGSNTVSVYRNTSSSGSITTGSFAAKVDFTTGTTPYYMALGDIDGDGKTDMVTANSGASTASVFRNTASSGSISSGTFATKFDLITGTNPHSVMLADMDGDGKADIVTSNSGTTTVSVIRNAAIYLPPTITSVSPNVANPGTSITITGTNFNTTAANNKVFFGATNATVTSASATSLSVTSPAGATYGMLSVTDTTTGGSGYEQYAYLPKFDNSTYISGTVNILPKFDLTSGTNPYSVAIADLDGDGKSDVVAANYASNTISIYRNISSTGTMTASSFATKVDFTTGTGPINVIVTDLDGDGKPDIVSTNYNAASISVFRNISSPGSLTTGSFTAKTDFTATGSASTTACGDIDGDGKVDLIIANNSTTTISVLRNQSAPGSLSAGSFATKVDFTTGSAPYGVAIGDLDGDGKPDVAVTNNTGSSISVLRNTASAGSITTSSLAAKVDFACGTNPCYLAIGDLDGDGKPEITIPNYGSNTLSILRNTSSSGSITTGSFATKVDFTTSTNPLGISLGDIDGDGKTDVTITNYTTSLVSVFRNTASSGSITTSSLAASKDYATGTNPRQVSVGDFDGDGKPDIVAANQNTSTISVLQNAALFTPPTITSVSPNVANPGTSITITGTNFNTTATNNKVFFGATKATVTSASATSLTVTAPTSAMYNMVAVTDSTEGVTGYEQYAYLPKYDNSAYISNTVNFNNKVDFTTGTTPAAAAIADLDGDGKPDMVVPNQGSNSVSVYFNTSSSGSITSGSFATKVDFTTGTAPAQVTIADLDGDGKPEIIVANSTANTVSVFKNTCTRGSITAGSFAAKIDYTTGTTPYNVCTGDIDGDGKPEIVVANSGTTTLSVFRNNTTPGSIVAGSFDPKVDFTTGTTPHNIAIGDVDGDGKPEVLVTNNGTTTVSVFKNTATVGAITTGSLAAKVDFTTGTTPQAVALGDIDGDGKPEMMVTNQGSNTVSVFRNASSSGSITTSSFAAKVDFTTGTTPYYVALGDIDGDGKTDMVTANSGASTASVFRNTASSGSISSGSFATKVDVTTGTNPHCVMLADMDGDGKADIVTSNSGTTTVSVIRNNPIYPPPVIASVSPNVANSGTSITITGTNFNTTAANNKVFFGATKATVTSASATSLTVTAPVGATYSMVSVTDTTTGASGYEQYAYLPKYDNSDYISNMVNFNNKVDFTTGTTPAAAAIADLDGDGKPDMVVPNQGSNSVSVYFNTSSSGSITSGSFATKVDFTTGTAPVHVTIADLDGDGKPEIIVPNSTANTVSVFKNTCTRGTITAGSFAAKIDYTTGTTPYNVCTRDLDGDGKPEIVVANSGTTTLSVFRNNTTPGSIVATSFDPKVDFTTGTTPHNIAIGDVDGDGKPEVLVANNGATTVSVFKNTATLGAITTGSLATKVDFTTGTTPQAVALGDIDGDGKPEMMVTNQGSNTVSVYRNTSSSGSITTGSFAAKVDFTTGTTPYYVALGDVDGDGKTDMVTANSGASTASVFRNTASSGSISSSSFATKVDVTTGTNPHCVMLADMDGDGKADIITSNSGTTTVSVIRNNPIYPPPVINSVNPNVANPGTSITITGTNFNTIAANNKVSFGATKATVTSASATSLTVTAPVGATYDMVSVTDTTTGASGYEQYAYLPTYNTSSYIPNSVSMASKVDFTSGTGPYWAAIADLDGDGKPDMVSINNAANTLSIFRNTCTTGSITSSSFATKLDLSTGVGPRGLAIADLDGDGKPEIICINLSSTTVSVYGNISSPGSLSSGSFASRVDFTTGTQPIGVAVGDIDGDGKPEIAVSNFGSNTVSVFKNTCGRSGISSTSFATKVDFTTGSNPIYVCLADLDGDGKIDIVANNNISNTLSVFRNTASLNNISSSSFATKVDFATGTNPWCSAIGDIDGDGKPDIVTANLGSATVSVFRNTSSSGSISTGSFATKFDFTVGTTPHFFSLGDINGDGKPDICVTDWSNNTVSVLRNTASSGSITSSSMATKVDFTTGTNPMGVAVGDFDGDGKPDLIVPNSTTGMSVYRNNAPFGIPTVTGVSPNSAVPGTSVTISGTYFNSDPTKDVIYFGAAKGTVTAASSTSLTVTVPTGATLAPVSVLNTESAFVAYEDSLFKPIFVNSYFKNDTLNFKNYITLNSATANAKPYTGAMGDIDGDGKIDMVVNNIDSGTATIMLNNSSTGSISSGSFTASIRVSFAGKPNNIKLADIDGDGKLDIVAALNNNNNVEVIRNTTTTTGTPTFATRTDLAAGTVSAVVSIVDLNADGKADIAVSLPSGLVGLFRNTSTPGTVSFATMTSVAVGAAPSGVCFADLDGDGKPDIATVNSGFTGSAYAGSTASIARNTSTVSALSFATAATLTTGSGPIDIAAGDIDGDRKPDLLVTNINDGTFSVLRNVASSGSLTGSSFSSRVNFTAGSGTTSIALADLNGDGKLDVAVSNAFSGTVSMFRNTATSGAINSGSFATRLDFGTGSTPITVTIGDLDGDKYPDVVVGNSGSRSVSVLRNYPLPKIAPIAGSTLFCIGSSSSTMTDSVAGGSWSATNSNATINASGLVTGVTPGTDTIGYVIVAGGDTASVIMPITINAMTWNGSISSDWNNAANWSCGYVPGASDDASIPAGTTNAPVIAASASGTTKNLTITSGVTVTVSSSATLSVKGTLLNNGTITGAGKLTMDNTTAQTVAGIGSISNFDINNANGVTVSSGARVTVRNTLSVSSGSLATGDSVVLYSDTFGTARVAAMPTGTSITGQVKVNQFMSGGRRAYRFWGHPFNDFIELSQLTNKIDITGPGGSSNGFTNSATNASSSFRYTPYSGNSALHYDPGWREFSSAFATPDSNKFKQYQGIRIYYRGSKGEGFTASPYVPSSTVISQKGVLNQGPQDVPMQKGTASGQDYNMIGNPYASPVDIGTVIFNAASAGRINSSFFYVWNPFLGTAGQFMPIPYTTGGASPSAIPYYLQTNNCVQIRALHDGDVLNFTESHKSANITSSYSLMKNGQDGVSLNLYDADHHLYDMLHVKFNDEATTAEDMAFDAGKPSGSDVNFYSLSSDNTKLSVDVRPYQPQHAIQLGLNSGVQQDYIIRVENVLVPANGRAYLHDWMTGRFIALQNGTEYKFSVTKDKNTQGDNRFELTIGTDVPVDAKALTGLVTTITPNPTTEDVSISIQQSKPGKVSIAIRDLTGVSVYNQSVNVKLNGTIKVPLTNLASGVYMLEVTSGQEKSVQRLIKE